MKSKSQGIPWRTAERANRYRVSTSCAYRKLASSSFKMGDEINDENENYDDEDDDNYDDLMEEYHHNKENIDENDTGVEFIEPNNRGVHRSKSHVNSTFDHEKFNSANRGGSQTGFLTSNSANRQRKHNEMTSKNEFASNLDKIKNMSVKDLLVILQREQESKTQLEDMLLQVKILINHIGSSKNFPYF